MEVVLNLLKFGFQEKNLKTTPPPKFCHPYKIFLKHHPQKISGYATGRQRFDSPISTDLLYIGPLKIIVLYIRIYKNSKNL